MRRARYAPAVENSGRTAADLAQAGREAERSGDLEEARRRFENALGLLTPADGPVMAASLFRWIAWTYANGGDPEAALDCLEVAEAVGAASGDDQALASVLNTRAGTLFNMGELDLAARMFWRVRSLAWRIRDRMLQAIADQNLGSVASIQGDLPTALRRFRSSLAAYEELGEMDYVGPMLNNIGRLQIEMGDDAGAEETLARAARHCADQGDVHHLIMVKVNQARILLNAGRYTAVRRACEDATALVRSTGDDRWLADIHLILGSAYARMGETELALGFLGRAAEVARRRQDAKVLADVLLEEAKAFGETGRNRQTLQRLNEAHRLFQHLRARRELADVDTRLSELEAFFLRIVQQWGESIESKDAYTQGHCTRVADLACALALASGISEEELPWFRMGALLHDVGKVAVPLEILNKKGPLDDEEFAVMATHPAAGVELLEGIEFPWDIRPMIRHHHERWDGTGYPDGLAGDAIPFPARILTVADVYDALTTDRSYRSGFSHVEAMRIMESEAGTTFDPEILGLFRDRAAWIKRTPASPWEPLSAQLA